jgi:hypothetical protein
MTTPAATPTPPQYAPGWVKQDIYNTLAVALRTAIQTPSNTKDWLVATIDRGARHTSWDEISHWPDLTTT